VERVLTKVPLANLNAMIAQGDSLLRPMEEIHAAPANLVLMETNWGRVLASYVLLEHTQILRRRNYVHFVNQVNLHHVGWPNVKFA